MNIIDRYKTKILEGGSLTEQEVYELVDATKSEEDRERLAAAAAEITKWFCEPVFDSCSIVNARSGRCSENCKWCAQSAHYHTGCETYEIVNREDCLAEARHNAEKGVKRFSLVASGKATTGRALDEICLMLTEAKETGLQTCASLGLLGETELKKLWDAGVRRYHCNLETAPSMFGELCTTHTIDDKIRTIRAAQQLGFEVCSGGIIGMGETRRQRAEFALKLREVNPVSIPINVLCPIPGTPLGNTPLLSEDDFIDAVAIFRFVHPHADLRFAGGRRRLSREATVKAMRTGINAGITGDLLTTVGSTIDEDKNLAEEAGLKF